MDFPTHKDLYQTFAYLSRQKFHGVAGTLLIKGKHRGERIVISSLTHGDEVSGLAAMHYLLTNKKRLEQELKGEILLTVNNILAGEYYFRAKKPNQKKGHIEANMNRLPENILERTSSREPYEIRRVIELYPLWKTASAGLDFHSTPIPTEPIIIDIKGKIGDLNKLSDGIPIQNRVKNIVKIQKGYAVGSLYGGLKNEIPVIEIENGHHEDPKAIKIAIQSVMAFLIKLKMLDGETKEKISIQHVYHIFGSVVFPDLSYRLKKLYPFFTPLKEGEIIATGNGKPIVAPLDCLALFGRRKLQYDNPERIKDEILFMSSPVKHRKRKLLIPSGL